MFVSVAFSGSGFKFPAHVGAIEAIEESGGIITELAATSGGAIVSSLYACGVKVDELIDLSLNFDWNKLIGLDFGALLSGAYCNGNKLYELYKELTSGKTFSDINLDLKIVASDATNNSTFLFSKETTPNCEIALAVKASSAIPFLFQPVTYEDKVLVDGAITNNIPMDHLSGLGIKLGVNLVSERIKRPIDKDLAWSWKMAPRLLDMMLTAAENVHISEGMRKGAILCNIDTGFASSLDSKLSYKDRYRLYLAGYKELINNEQIFGKDS